MPNIMIVGLNTFPTKNGISTTLSHRNFIEGKCNQDYNQLKYQFGMYGQLYEDTGNTQMSRSIIAIALNPTNDRKGYHFMSLKQAENYMDIYSNHYPLQMK